MRIEGEMARALPVLETLLTGGCEAVFVGGCVRDTYMGRQLKDIDIATSATPDQVMALFPHHIPTGLAHGTVTVLWGGNAYEVTTYRKESAYEKFRRPSEVEFVTDLEADLLRRDFTMNAMALRSDGTLVDPFHGADDLNRGILRCVGEADARFQEDALRMVRAVRFAAEFKLRIALGTWRALRRHAKLLVHVAMERVGAEADKMMGGSDPKRAAVLFARSGLLQHTKQELPASIVHAAADSELLGQSGDGESGSRSLDRTDLHWLLLLLALNVSPEDTEALFDALRYSTQRRAAAVSVMQIAARMRRPLADAQDTARLWPEDKLHAEWLEAILDGNRMAAEHYLYAASLMERNRTSEGVTLLPLFDRLARWLKELPASSIRDLAVRGSDLMRELRKPSGPWLGALLKELLREAAFRRIPNDSEALLQKAVIMMEEQENGAT